ncbi:S-type anion channel SLAH2-like [Typha angustifolia]|uniref:S-type anion channel SLAH2-like n=1 Tax=Typha angustifolia TaxID=59011 RepID=UPI003C3083C1
MENKDNQVVALPQAVISFDVVGYGNGMNGQSQPCSVNSSEGGKFVAEVKEVADFGGQDVVISMPPLSSSVRAEDCDYLYSLSLSLPASPSGLHIGQTKTFTYSDNFGAMNSQLPPQGKFYSQPMLTGSLYENEAQESSVIALTDGQKKVQRNESMRDKRFDSFKTWSGRLERQLSNLRGRPQEPDLEENDIQGIEIEDVPAVQRYFDALEGPELDTLKASEVSVLPEDKMWPFLLRFPINSFGMCLGVSSQAILWKTLATSPTLSFLHVSLTVNLVLWCISIALMGFVSLLYSLKIIFYFEAVRREYYHPVRVNFFFAPWIACLFLTLGVPPSVAVNLHPIIWYILMAPIFCLELKIYGQWMSGGQRRLSKVANASNHLSIVGNFVGALLGASMGLKEGPIFFFAVGLAHYIVLFVTLYQRLPTNAALPKELHPVFFLFVAAPSVACTAWATINGEFDNGARIAYFIALFLYMSLAVRINFFRGFRFSLAWWAYTFPMTAASIATMKYSVEVTNVFTRALSIGLSAISTFTVSALLVATIVHAFVLRDLFPNDISIAITQKKPKFRKMLAHLRSANSDLKDLDSSVSRGTPVH